MNTQLIVEPKLQWGETRIYPKCPTSELFTRLLGQETLTPANIQGIIRLGYTIKAEYTEPKGVAGWMTIDTSV
jgi:hypothetical protein